jgi:hypothetical protein
MSPTIFRERGYRFFFFSREETRPHVHVYCADGEAKFWLEPQIELARNYRLSKLQLREIESIIEDHSDELKSAWQHHFSS